MRFLRSTLPALLFVATASSGAADIQTDMRNIAQFCMQYIETGQKLSTLSRSGFSARGRKYNKSYNSSVIGGRNPVITVDARKSNAGLGCSAQFGIIGRSDGEALFKTAQNAALAAGYQMVTYTDRKGRPKTGYQKQNVLMEVGGSTKYRNYSYSTFLYFQRLN